MAKRIQAVVATSKPLWAIGLQVALQLSRVEMVGIARNEQQTITLLERHWPQLLILDLEPAANMRVEAFIAKSQRQLHVVHVTSGRDRAALPTTVDIEGVRSLIVRWFPRARRAANDLTSRELEIVQLLAAGQRPSDIARLLCISDNTVKTHLAHINQKLNASSQLEIVRWWHTVTTEAAQQHVA